MSRVLTRIALAGSGAILGLIGSFIMFAPQVFLATSEVIVEHDPGLMSEVTAPSVLLITTGALMMLGAIKLRFANIGLVSGAVVYGSYGLSRLISMHLHGIPSETLIVATHFELFVAAILAAIRVRAALDKQRNLDEAYRGEMIV